LIAKSPPPNFLSAISSARSATLKTILSSLTQSKLKTSALEKLAITRGACLPSESTTASALRPVPAPALIASHLPDGDSCASAILEREKNVSTDGGAAEALTHGRRRSERTAATS